MGLGRLFAHLLDTGNALPRAGVQIKMHEKSDKVVYMFLYSKSMRNSWPPELGTLRAPLQLILQFKFAIPALIACDLDLHLLANDQFQLGKE